MATVGNPPRRSIAQTPDETAVENRQESEAKDASKRARKRNELCDSIRVELLKKVRDEPFDTALLSDHHESVNVLKKNTETARKADSVATYNDRLRVLHGEYQPLAEEAATLVASLKTEKVGRDPGALVPAGRNHAVIAKKATRPCQLRRDLAASQRDREADLGNWDAHIACLDAERRLNEALSRQRFLDARMNAIASQISKAEKAIDALAIDSDAGSKHSHPNNFRLVGIIDAT